MMRGRIKVPQVLYISYLTAQRVIYIASIAQPEELEQLCFYYLQKKNIDSPK